MQSRSALARRRWVPIVAGSLALLAGCTGQIAAGDDVPGARGSEAPGSPGGRPGDPATAGAGSSATGANAGSPGASAGPNCAETPQPARLWKLTPPQYSRTVQALLPAETAAGAALADTLGGSDKGWIDPDQLLMTEPHVDALFTTATRLGVKAASALFICKGAADTACVSGSVATLGRKLFRRPLTTEESGRYGALYAKEVAVQGTAGAAEIVARAMLLSPHFLFRTELGADDGKTGVVDLTPHEKASALSYLLADAPPDAELAAAADAGRLVTAADLAPHARRLLATPAQAQGVTGFFRGYLGYDDVKGVSKDNKVYPTFSDDLATAMVEEDRQLVEYTLWQGGGKLDTLFTTTVGFVNALLARSYGLSGVTGTAYKMVTLPPERAGVLTRGSFLSAHATDIDTNAVGRGKWVREELLCTPLPPPPPTANAVPPPPDGKLTMRERLAHHSADPSCATCHKLMDPIGLAFEIYDGIGQYRTAVYGKTIDATGEVVSSDVAGKTFVGAAAMEGLLAGTMQVRGCLAQHAYRAVSGRAALDQTDQCALNHLTSGALADGSVLPFMAEVAVSNSLRQRVRQ